MPAGSQGPPHEPAWRAALNGGLCQTVRGTPADTSEKIRGAQEDEKPDDMEESGGSDEGNIFLS